MKQFLSLSGGAKFFALFFVMLSFCTTNVQAQTCPASITATAPNVTAATCKSNGAIVVNSNAPAPNATYQIITGPAAGGFQTTAQSSNNFTGLPAGAYTIRITCGAATADVTATIADAYTPLTLAPTVSNVCGSAGTQGGTINANIASTGKAPFSYAYWQGDPAQSDATLTYQVVNTTSTTNAFTVPSFGTYQVRVKDACNEFITKPIDVVPLYPKARTDLDVSSSTCSTNTFNAYPVQVANVAPVDYTAGYKYEVYDITGATACPTTISAGTPLLQSGTITAAPFTFTQPGTVKNLAVKTISPCGEETISCYQVDHSISMGASIILPCPATAGGTPSTVDLLFWAEGRPTWPIKVTVTPKTGATPGTPIIKTNIASNDELNALFYNTPYADQYDYVIEDACGRIETGTKITPVSTDSIVITPSDGYVNCVNQPGTKVIQIFIRGYNPGATLFTATIKNAAGTPVWTTDNGYTNGNGYINLDPVSLPPGNYTIDLTPVGAAGTVCKNFLNIPFTINTTQILKFNFSAKTSQLCGGTGTITSTLDYNGGQPVTFKLLNAAGDSLTSNTSGSFANLAAGTYKVIAIADYSTAAGCGKANLSDTTELTITPAGAPPVIVKKIGVNCDGSGGGAFASFEMAGFAPFKLEMKKTTEPATAFVVKSTNAPTTYTVTGLEPNTDYDVRLTDNCGVTSTTQVSTKPLLNIILESKYQPCGGQPYKLSVEQVAGATYSWTYNGAARPETTADINFGIYNPATNDGTYVCTIQLGGCVTRTVTVSLNSIECSAPLPVKLVAFNATAAGTKALLSWVTSSEQNAKGFGVQRSADAVNWNEIGFVASKAPNGTSTQQLSYNFYDNSPLQSANYYRLRQTDLDGKQTLSDTRKVVFGKNDEVSIFPNPANKGIWITTSSAYENKAATINLYSFDGKLVLSQKVSALSSSQYIDVSKLMTGKYAVRILMNNEVINKTIQIIK